MATKTASAAQANVQPQAVHAGTTRVQSKFSLSGTALSAGDVIWAIKVPDGAVINDVLLYCQNSVHDGTTTGKTILAVGDGDAASRYMSATFTANFEIQRMTNGAGKKYDLSDADISQYDTIDITVRTVGSDSGSHGAIILDVAYTLGQTSQSRL